jgi:hypothetical protein
MVGKIDRDSHGRAMTTGGHLPCVDGVVSGTTTRLRPLLPGLTEALGPLTNGWTGDAMSAFAARDKPPDKLCSAMCRFQTNATQQRRVS